MAQDMTQDMTLNADIAVAVQTLSQALLARDWRMTCAESCTGGMIAARCTDVAGSSLWFDRGFVTYSNDAKVAMLGVPQAMLVQHGAVSEAVVRAMVLGALEASGAQAAVAVSGVAGPGGGTALKPVGLVWLAWAVHPVGAAQPSVTVHHEVFAGDRGTVRQSATRMALARLASLVAATDV
jgi:nicotinamide-nucleotide amidase